MKDWQQRVVDEQKELDTKRQKLSDFISNPANATMDRDEMNLLISQYRVMTSYSTILGTRIARFKS